MTTQPTPSGAPLQTTSSSSSPPSPSPTDDHDPITDLGQLASLLTGTLARPGDPHWDDARRAWQLLVDQHPAAVVTAADERDVILTVRAAAALGLRVAAQNTGHNASPLGDLSRTILVRTGALTRVHTDPATRVARVGAGARWGDLQAAASALGLMGVGGFSYDVGVIGLLLGGGLGWLARSHGLAASWVVGCDVVTGDGVRRHVDDDEDPDLFRAVLRGADVAVILSVDLRLHPAPEMTAGALFWPAGRSCEVFHRWARWTEQLPEEVTSVVRLLRIPDAPGVPPFLAGRDFAVVELVAQLPGTEVDTLVAPLRELSPEIDTIAAASPDTLGALHMDPPEPVPAATASAVLHSLTPQSLDALVDTLGSGTFDSGTFDPGSARGLTSVELRDLRGALGRGEETAVSRARALMVAVAVAPPPGEGPPGAATEGEAGDAATATGGGAGADPLAAGRAGLEAVARALEPVTAPVGLRSMTESRVDPRCLWDEEELAVLREAKHRWDPRNLVHANHSVG